MHGPGRSAAGTAAARSLARQVKPYLAHKITPPENKVETSTKELMEMFSLMYKMRRMEIASDMAYKAKLIRGFCHL